MRTLPVTLLTLVLSCTASTAQPRPRAPGSRTAAAPKIVASIFSGGLQGTWEDHGWAERKKRTAGAEVLVMSGYGGWILANSHFTGTWGGLVFRFRAPTAAGDFFEVRVDNEKADIFPRVQVGPQHRRDLEAGWSEVFVPMGELNPGLAPFNRVVLRARTAIGEPGLVEIDGVGLTEADAALVARADSQVTTPGLPAAFSVDCTADAVEISPLIYGIGFSALRELESDHQWKVKPTVRRWGGNPTSRYNWELGNAWNTGSDYFFENTDYGHGTDFTWATFLDTNRDRQVKSVLTVPTLGWVAKDTKSSGFPVDEFGAQQQTAPERPGAGNGVAKNGKPLTPGPPGRTSIAAPPEFIGRWVAAIKKADLARGGKSVAMYILDNEPMLWHDTHRDVHPVPATYDELLERTIKYGTAVRKADPDAIIAGPAEWGWPGYLYSAADAEAGFNARPDRRAHGDAPLIEWYLRRVAAHEKDTGVRVLDVLDLHYYPQAKGLGVGTEGKTDPDTNALRIRSTRSLWDPRYTDESWVKEPIRLIPRMREWVEKNDPGLKLSIGEYNFGAERHPSGGLALAEALGRFGQQGLYSAFYWTYPPDGSPAFWAFRAYRDYDGKGARFLDWSLPTEAPRDASLFASRSADGRKVTIVALNFSTTDNLDAHIDLRGCAVADSQRVFTYSGDPRGFIERPTPLGASFRLPAYSIVVIEQTLPKAAKPRPQTP